MKTLTRQFRRALVEDERNYLAYADITLANNTVLQLTNSELWTGGFSYEEVVSEDDNFTALGSAVIGSAEVVIDNTEEQYSAYDFTNADVVLYLGMQFEDRLEKFKVGTYRVDDPVYNGATVKLSLLDNMEQFDRPYSISTLVYPATLYTIVQDACTTCGVQFSATSQTFPHYQYQIAERPTDESITFREVLSWVAQIAGCYVKCNPDGDLVLGWFNTTLLDEAQEDLDGGTFNPWSTGTTYDGGTMNPWSEGDVYEGGNLSSDRNAHYINSLWSQNISMDDVVITGLSIKVKNPSDTGDEILEYNVGTSDYVIEISDNEFITPTNADEIKAWLGTLLIGLRFRKLNVVQTSDPSIESGDVGFVIDRKQNIYRVLITRMSFSVDGGQTIVCGATTPSRNNATRFSESTKSYVEARKLLKKEKSARDQAIADLEEAIENSSGVYTTIETPQGGGKIYYLHDKPDLADSSMVWKMTASAWAVTDDWQGSDAATSQANKWNAGMTVDGTFLATVINTMSAFFDYAHGGTLVLGGNQNQEGELIIKNGSGTEIARINNSGINVGNGKFLVNTNGEVTAMAFTAYGSLICYESYTIT